MDNLRNFEISVWTLQDSFITVLEDSYNKLKGKTQDASMTLNIDGTQELTFTIPRKFDVGGQFITNPAWESTLNGQILVNTRKVKVILNKKTNDEEVYEFVIDKVTERHENDELYCDITCSGLAFYELGKVGYKIYLSSEDFYADDLSWFYHETDEDGFLLFPNQPIANIQYWLNKFLTPLEDEDNIKNNTFENFKWYYALQMDWDHQFNYPGMGRSKHRIYEDTKEYEPQFTAKTQINNVGDVIYPSDRVVYKEKARMIDLEESNIYNLTQNIAEIFEVFCKYQYIYDSNYHIIGRVVIFYNSFLLDNNQLSITYRNQTSSISREIDSTDLVTKMYVKTVDDNDDFISIIDVEDNPTGEDYVLNFDYLYKVGTISEEQYQYVSKFKTEIKEKNLQLKPISDMIADLENQIIDVSARKATAEAAVGLDKEQITAMDALLLNLTNNTDRITRDENNPDTAILRKNEGDQNYYINITTQGVLAETVKIYTKVQYGNQKLTGEITTGRPEFDEIGNLIKFVNLYSNDINGSRVYLTYTYRPKLYYENIKNDWLRRLKKDENDFNNACNELELLEGKLEAVKVEQKQLLDEKQTIVSNFEEMMGPAIREGYWQPENYSDSGNTYVSNYYMTKSSTIEEGKSGIDYFTWDVSQFDEEQKISYYIGVEQNTNYYKCINLSEVWDLIKDNPEQYSFLFYDYEGSDLTPHEYSKIKSFTIGSQAVIQFVEHNGEIIPVLLLIGGETINEDTWNIIKANHCYIGIFKTNFDDNTGVISGYEVLNQYNVAVSDWIDLSAGYSARYPRIYIESLGVKNSEDQLALTIGNSALTNFNDYQVLTKLVPSKKDDIAIVAYLITIKPQALYKDMTFSSGKFYLINKLSIMFTLSNADSAIYNDAVNILEESAYPQVSYEFNYDIFKNGCLKVPSKYLNHIVKINDYELKFNDVRGYISGITLDLDRPWQDSLEIQNYRTKFEDLFSNILAQTEAMKKNEYVFNNMYQAFDTSGNLRSSTVQKTLMGKNLNFAFNDGSLTIDEKNGIWGISDSGVVAFRGGGIFTATEKDESDNWKWNTGITPEGINANLITTGQLDTNRIRIFAGDRLRLQMNENGLFAYKSFFEDFSALYSAGFNDEENRNTIFKTINDPKENGDIDAAQYVKFDENGLFLVAMDGALVLNEEKTGYEKVEDKTNHTGKVERVAITWNGFTLRNYAGKRTFYADADTGNLTLEGTVQAAAGWFGGEQGWKISGNTSGSQTEGIIKSANGRVELRSGFSNTSPSIIFKNTNGNEIFAFKNDNLTIMGNGTFSGTVTASAGLIGPWHIADKSIYMRNTSVEPTLNASDAVYFGTEGLSFYNTFKIKLNSQDQTLQQFTVNNANSDTDYLFRIEKGDDNDYNFNIRRVTFEQDLINSIINFIPKDRTINCYYYDENGNKILDENLENGKLEVVYNVSQGAVTTTSLRSLNYGTAAERGDTLTSKDDASASNFRHNIYINKVKYNYLNVYYSSSSTNSAKIGMVNSIPYGFFRFYRVNSLPTDYQEIEIDISRTTSRTPEGNYDIYILKPGSDHPLQLSEATILSSMYLKSFTLDEEEWTYAYSINSEIASLLTSNYGIIIAILPITTISGYSGYSIGTPKITSYSNVINSCELYTYINNQQYFIGPVHYSDDNNNPPEEHNQELDP